MVEQGLHAGRALLRGPRASSSAWALTRPSRRAPKQLADLTRSTYDQWDDIIRQLGLVKQQQ